MTGLGFVVLTMIVTVGDGQTGKYEVHEVAYRDDGIVVSAKSERGEYKSTGKFKWATTGVIKADARAFVEKEAMELAAKTWTGELYEAICAKQ